MMFWVGPKFDTGRFLVVIEKYPLHLAFYNDVQIWVLVTLEIRMEIGRR